MVPIVDNSLPLMNESCAPFKLSMVCFVLCRMKRALCTYCFDHDEIDPLDWKMLMQAVVPEHHLKVRQEKIIVRWKYYRFGEKTKCLSG